MHLALSFSTFCFVVEITATTHILILTNIAVPRVVPKHSCLSECSPQSGQVTAQDCKLNALTDMVQSFAGIVESTSRLGSDAPEEDTLHAVAALYQSRANSAPLLAPRMSCRQWISTRSTSLGWP